MAKARRFQLEASETSLSFAITNWHLCLVTQFGMHYLVTARLGAFAGARISPVNFSKTRFGVGSERMEMNLSFSLSRLLSCDILLFQASQRERIKGNQHTDSELMARCIVLIKQENVHGSCMTDFHIDWNLKFMLSI